MSKRKYTWDLLERIEEALKQKELSLRDIAREYGLSYTELQKHLAVHRRRQADG